MVLYRILKYIAPFSTNGVVDIDYYFILAANVNKRRYTTPISAGNNVQKLQRIHHPKQFLNIGKRYSIVQRGPKPTHRPVTFYTGYVIFIA